MEDKIIILDFLLFGPLWIPIIMYIKGYYNFNYLRMIEPDIFPGYNSYLDAVMLSQWNSEIIMLGMPFFTRNISKENQKAAKIVIKIKFLIYYIYFALINTILLLIYLKLQDA